MSKPHGCTKNNALHAFTVVAFLETLTHKDSRGRRYLNAIRLEENTDARTIRRWWSADTITPKSCISLLSRYDIRPEQLQRWARTHGYTLVLRGQFITRKD